MRIKIEGHRKIPSRLTGPRSTASKDMIVNTCPLLLSDITSREEVDDALTLTLGIKEMII